MVMKGTLAIDFWVDDYLDVSSLFFPFGGI